MIEKVVISMEKILALIPHIPQSILLLNSIPLTVIESSNFGTAFSAENCPLNGQQFHFQILSKLPKK
jgi:hypothetical protein